MDWGIVGTIVGILALASVVYTLGRYAGRFDTLWSMRNEISGAIIKIDTLWKIYIEETIIRHSNPGNSIMLPDELKDEIKNLLNNNEYFGKVKEPTLLIIHSVGIEKFTQIARSNKADLGQVLAEVNSYVFEYLTKH